MNVAIFIVMYGGILLPPTCKINYVNMQHNYVNMRLIYVDMQHNYVDMHVINFCQNYFFLRVNFLTNAIIWYYTYNIIMSTCDIWKSMKGSMKVSFFSSIDTIAMPHSYIHRHVSTFVCCFLFVVFKGRGPSNRFLKAWVLMVLFNFLLLKNS